MEMKTAVNVIFLAMKGKVIAILMKNVGIISIVAQTTVQTHLDFRTEQIVVLTRLHIQFSV